MKKLPWRSLFLLTLVLNGPCGAEEVLRPGDLAGWWTADPVRGGESSHVALQFLEREGKLVAELSLPAIGVYAVSLGEVSVNGNALDTRPLAFPLTWDAQHHTLSGVLPHDAVPVYDIRVEFRRGAPLIKPEPPRWQAQRPTVKWSIETGAPVWAGLAYDAKTATLYVGNEAGVLNAIDTSGNVRWKMQSGQPVRGRPAVIDDSVYVTSDNGLLYRLDKNTGREEWRVAIDTGSPARIPTNQEGSRWDRYGSSVVADAQRVYVASRDKNLYAIDRDTGREAWRVAMNDIMTATPVLYRDMVICASFDGTVQAMATKDARVRWRYDAKLAVSGDLVIDAGHVLIGSRSYDLIALDAADGKELWKHYYWFSWIESPPVVHDGVAYTGSSDAVGVYAVNVNDGSQRWKASVPGWAWARPAVNDGFVVAGTVGAGAYPGFRSGALVALERSGGAIRWIFLEPPTKNVLDEKRGWGFGASPLIVGDVVYAADLNGRVHALALQ